MCWQKETKGDRRNLVSQVFIMQKVEWSILQFIL